LRNVTKNIFLNSIVCPSLGWLMRHDQVKQTPTIGERFRMEQGMEIERRAREIYPEGVLIDEKDPVSAIEMTKRIIADKSTPVIFSAFFIIDNFTTKSDILIRKDNDSWHMMEVKSSTNDKPEFIDDMAYTTMVMNRFGLNVSRISLLLVSKDFRLGMQNKDLFKEIDHTKEVFEKVEGFMPLWEKVDEATSHTIKPESNLVFECKNCIIFKECLGSGIENHIFDIPRLRGPKFKQLIDLDIVKIEDIPPSFPLTEIQSIVKTCVQRNAPFIGEELEAKIQSINWPAYYLDFETINPAIPLYPDIAPYTNIPTQFSIHQCSEPGKIVKHAQYLADPSKDCRRKLAEQLIHELEGKSSIIVYSNFEKIRINELIIEFPDLSDELNSLIERLVNLQLIIQRNFYHPGFHGSTSVKNVAPVLIPDISYDELEISDGSSAMAVFVYLAYNRYDEPDIEVMKENLRKYCELDSLSLVGIHQKICEYL